MVRVSAVINAGVMFELRIETAPKALELLQAKWPTRAISLVGDDLRFELPCFGQHHLILRFHDVEELVSGYVAPTTDDLERALTHARGLGGSDRLLIHCHAGKSRSPAMAMGILIDHGLTPDQALDRVKAAGSFVIPNRLMIRHLDELLGLHGGLVDTVRRHYKELPPDASLPDRGGWNF